MMNNLNPWRCDTRAIALDNSGQHPHLGNLKDYQFTWLWGIIE